MTSGVQPETDQPGPGQPGPAQPVPGRPGPVSTVVFYVVLTLFGIAQGVLGSFFYGTGPVPLVAAGFDVAIFATCVLGGWGAGRPAGALAPAAGWFCATFVLALGTPSGSVLIVTGIAGEWFLFGGAAAAAAGVVTEFVLWTRASLRGARQELPGREPGRGRP